MYVSFFIIILNIINKERAKKIFPLITLLKPMKNERKKKMQCDMQHKFDFVIMRVLVDEKTFSLYSVYIPHIVKSFLLSYITTKKKVIPSFAKSYLM